MLVELIHSSMIAYKPGGYYMSYINCSNSNDINFKYDNVDLPYLCINIVFNVLYYCATGRHICYF